MSNKKLTLAITGTAFAFGSLGVLAAPAGAAHQHYLETPGGNTILLPCEPAGTAAATNHPIHYKLHWGPSQDERAIEVGKYTSSCTNPLPTGPTGD